MGDLPIPKFLRLSKITSEDIVKLIKAVRVIDVSRETKLKIWDLAHTKPEARLALNCMTVLRLCSEHRVETITEHGITNEERRVLIDLEDSGMRDSTLKIAHSLLNLKERWFLVKAMRDSFRRERDSGNFITSNSERTKKNGNTIRKQEHKRRGGNYK